jgi:chromosome segregation ATPase
VKTKEEKIKLLYDVIAAHASTEWGSGSQARVKCIQKHLNAIKKLLEPEPESLAASVLRLTNICNELGRENATLCNDLTDMTLNFNAAEKHARQLKEEIVRKNDTLKRAHSNLAWFKKVYEDELTDAWARAAHRKKLLVEAKERIGALLRRNQKLEEDLNLADTHIKELQKDLTTLTRQNWRRGK